MPMIVALFAMYPLEQLTFYEGSHIDDNAYFSITAYP